jgi:signal transduction histidine kinase
MRKVALVFVLAVIAPSLVLAWLAVRSLRDQQFLLERQQSLLYQRVTDAVARDISNRLSEEQQDFSALAESLVASTNARVAAVRFDDELHRRWPLADVGFCVTLSGRISCPSPAAGLAAQRFLLDNSGFLGNREAAEVYWNINPGKGVAQNAFPSAANNTAPAQNAYATKAQARAVNPQGGLAQTFPYPSSEPPESNLSKIIPAEAEFRQLIGDGTDGMLARFLEDKLKLMFWHRLNGDPDLIFGAQLNLPRVVDALRDLVQAEPALRDEICLALLDDDAKPVLLSRAGFAAAWKRPFVATEIGEALPHWEVAAYLIDPARLTEAAQTARATLGLLIALLVLAIGVGSWLIVHCLKVELKLARQKTDFVSNVSHELKTPLTSIRMFSELLAEGRVTDPARQQSYLTIITAEAGRLTRLINNVLDFSRLESRKYHFGSCDLSELARAAAQTFRPQLEAAGFKFECALPDEPIPVRGDSDALSQVIVNLLSNAEKFSNSQKEITVRAARRESPAGLAEITVCDRGMGVPGGCGEKIFDKFYRAHDSLSSGIPGSGLGLTIARQIARAHGGEVAYEPRPGGGSCFSLRLPLAAPTA